MLEIWFNCSCLSKKNSISIFKLLFHTPFGNFDDTKRLTHSYKMQKFHNKHLSLEADVPVGLIIRGRDPRDSSLGRWGYLFGSDTIDIKRLTHPYNIQKFHRNSITFNGSRFTPSIIYIYIYIYIYIFSEESITLIVSFFLPEVCTLEEVGCFCFNQR